MGNFNALDGSRMVDAAVKQIPVEDRIDSRFFVFDPEEATLLHVETDEGTVGFATGGFLYRADFFEEGSYKITLVL
jgi:hypothetical protein